MGSTLIDKRLISFTLIKSWARLWLRSFWPNSIGFVWTLLGLGCRPIILLECLATFFPKLEKAACQTLLPHICFSWTWLFSVCTLYIFEETRWLTSFAAKWVSWFIQDVVSGQVHCYPVCCYVSNYGARGVH